MKSPLSQIQEHLQIEGAVAHGLNEVMIVKTSASHLWGKKQHFFALFPY
jgi:hypothetical protein